MALLAEGIRGAELVIFEHSSHMAFIEERERYLSVLAGFLARTDQAAAQEPGWSGSTHSP